MPDDIGSALRDGLGLVFTFVPKLLLFLVILLIGWLIAKALRKGVNALLERVGFDRAVERGGAKAEAEANSGRAAADLGARTEVSSATRTDELPLHRDGNGAYAAPDGGPTHAR